MKWVLFLIAVALPSFASAQTADALPCTPGHPQFDTSKCVTTGIATAGTIGSGIYTASQYSQADSIEAKYTEQVYSGTASSGGDPGKVTSSFTQGDKITVNYEMGPNEGRAHYIEEMQDATHNLDARISSLKMQAEASTDRGENSLAKSQLEEVQRLQLQANVFHKDIELAQNGGAITPEKYIAVIENQEHTADFARAFIANRVAQGDVITSIKRLPFERIVERGRLIRNATGGLAGMVLGAGLFAEESTLGAIANAMKPAASASTSSFTPAMQSFDSASVPTTGQ